MITRSSFRALSQASSKHKINKLESNLTAPKNDADEERKQRTETRSGSSETENITVPTLTELPNTDYRLLLRRRGPLQPIRMRRNYVS